jgi:hypothetical protein
MDIIARLEAQMAKAVEDQDFETAASLRDTLERLQRGESGLREQRPGSMGLGSSQEAYVRDPAKPLPKKPNPLTANHAKGGRRKG